MADQAFSEKAKHALCKAHRGLTDAHGGPLYIIRRIVWSWNGPSKRNRDMVELYDAGLIEEWFTPWSPLHYLTEKGEELRKAWRKELGYD
jgi:hypothetical protein